MVLLGPILSGPNYKQGGLINKGTSDWPEEDLWESKVSSLFLNHLTFLPKYLNKELS